MQYLNITVLQDICVVLCKHSSFHMNWARILAIIPNSFSDCRKFFNLLRWNCKSKYFVLNNGWEILFKDSWFCPDLAYILSSLAILVCDWQKLIKNLFWFFLCWYWWSCWPLLFRLSFLNSSSFFQTFLSNSQPVYNSDNKVTYIGSDKPLIPC